MNDLMRRLNALLGPHAGKKVQDAKVCRAVDAAEGG